MDFGIASVAGITVICYLAGMFIMPDFPAQDVINAAAIGIVSGLAATGINQAAKQLRK